MNIKIVQVHLVIGPLLIFLATTQMSFLETGIIAYSPHWVSQTEFDKWIGNSVGVMSIIINRLCKGMIVIAFWPWYEFSSSLAGHTRLFLCTYLAPGRHSVRKTSIGKKWGTVCAWDELKFHTCPHSGRNLNQNLTKWIGNSVNIQGVGKVLLAIILHDTLWFDPVNHSKIWHHFMLQNLSFSAN